ncbi:MULTISPECIES: zf-HC2 domain-containing protein [unclassified Frankia]|uniref:zf-HC2 domain-containing protein n=1 Tax=unclassified Frankia TaxID=2632575 RepID=UPI002024EC4B
MSEHHLGDRIAPLVDGQLDHDDRDRALAHLARCPACQWEVAELRRLKARLAALGGPVLPGCVADRLLRMAAAAIPTRFVAGTPSATDNDRVLAGPAFPAGSAFPASPMLPADPAAPVGYPVAQPPAGIPERFRSGHPHGWGDVHAAGSTWSPPQAHVPTGRRAFTAGTPAVPAAVILPAALSEASTKEGWTAAGRPSPRVAPRVTTPATGGRRPRPGPADPRVRAAYRRSRARRTLVGSAAVLLFAVAGAAFGEARAPSGLPASSTLPAVVPVVQPSFTTGVTAVRVSRLAPTVSVVSVPVSVRRPLAGKP